MADITANDLEALLRARYSPPAWAFVTNVCESTENRRRCDAMAVGQWHSVGHHLHGFEIKSERGDWKNEIDDPAKAETFAQFCDYWWIVAPKGVVKIEEMPATWGLLGPSNGGLRVQRASTKRDPLPLSRGLLVMLTRRAAEQSPAEEVLKAARQAARSEGFEDGKRSAERSLDPDNPAYARLVKTVQEFEDAAGIKIETYDAGRIGEAVKVALGGVRAASLARGHMEYARDSMKRAATTLEEYLNRSDHDAALPTEGE